VPKLAHVQGMDAVEAGERRGEGLRKEGGAAAPEPRRVRRPRVGAVDVLKSDMVERGERPRGDLGSRTGNSRPVRSERKKRRAERARRAGATAGSSAP